MRYYLYVCNKDSKGRVEAYGWGHSTKESAETHRKNIRKRYNAVGRPKDLKGTRLVKEEGKHKPLTSNQILEKYFKGKK